MDIQKLSLLSSSFQASKGPAHCCVFSSGLGNHLLTGGQDRTLRLFNPKSGALVQTYNGHGYEVLGIEPSHDNTRLASCGGDRSVFWWDVASAQPIKRFSGHTARVNAVALNNESTIMASGSFDASVRLWDLKSQQWAPIQILDQAKDSITAVLITETEIFTACVDGYVRCYDLRQGELRADYFENPVTSMSITKDRNVLLVSTLDSTMRLMDLTTGKMLVKYKGLKNDQYRVKHSLDARDEIIVAGDEAGQLHTWKMENAEPFSSQPIANEDQITKTCLWTATHPSTREDMVATASGDGIVRVWKRRKAV